MEFPTQSFSFFTICLLIFLSTFLPANAASKLVDSVCKYSADPITTSKCQQLIGSDPKTKDLDDPKKLSEIVLHMALDNAQSSYDFINQMVKTNPAEPIKRCLSWYQAAVASFRSSLGELEDDPQTSNYDAKTAQDNADSCEKDLAGGPPVPEISARNDQVRLHSRIADGATNMLQLDSNTG